MHNLETNHNNIETIQIDICKIIDQIRLSRGLALAIQENDTDTVRAWLRAGANPNAYCDVERRRPALSVAIGEMRGKEVMDPEEPWEYLETCYFVPGPNNTMLMEALIEAGADVNASPIGEEPILMLAVRYASPEVVKLLIAHGANTSTQYKYRNMTPLHYASSYRNADIVRALLDGGAQIDIQDRFDDTPLTSTIKNCFETETTKDHLIAVIEELLERGASIDLPGKPGKTVLDLLPRNVFIELREGSWIRQVRKIIERHISLRNKNHP